jgi:DDE superfamily endonuclease
MKFRNSGPVIAVCMGRRIVHSPPSRALSGLRLTDSVWGTRSSRSSTREQAVGGLSPAELTLIRGRLEAFADGLLGSLGRIDQRARGRCYLRGLLLAGRRRSIEPMAARLGVVHYQALHHFIAVSPGTGGRSAGGGPRC